MNNYIISKTN